MSTSSEKAGDPVGINVGVGVVVVVMGAAAVISLVIMSTVVVEKSFESSCVRYVSPERTVSATAGSSVTASVSESLLALLA